MLIQWDGSKIDKWLKTKEGNEPTLFEICKYCYEEIITGELDANEFLIPINGEPTDKFLYVAEYKSHGCCRVCKGRC